MSILSLLACAGDPSPNSSPSTSFAESKGSPVEHEFPSVRSMTLWQELLAADPLAPRCVSGLDGGDDLILVSAPPSSGTTLPTRCTPKEGGPVWVLIVGTICQDDGTQQQCVAAASKAPAKATVDGRTVAVTTRTSTPFDVTFPPSYGSAHATNVIAVERWARVPGDATAVGAVGRTGAAEWSAEFLLE